MPTTIKELPKIIKMKKFLILSALALSVVSLDVQAQTKNVSATYGTPKKAEQVMSPGRLTWLLKDKPQSEYIQLGGYISEVVANDGSSVKFRTTKDIHDDILVTVEDKAFTLPASVAGKKAMLSGFAKKKSQPGAKDVFEMEVTAVEIFE